MKLVANWLRKAGLLVSVLLALLILDGTRPALTPQTVSQAPSVQHALTIHLFAASAEADGSSGSASTPLNGEVRLLAERDGAFFEVLSRGTESGKLTVKLPEGRYWVIARAEGRARVGRPVLVERPRELSLVLEVARRLEVAVVAEQKGEVTPLRKATVLVARPGELPRAGETDASGKLSLEGLPPGPLRVEVFAAGFQPYEAVTEGDLLVRLRPVRTLRVFVLDQGTPVPGATISIAGIHLWPARDVQTGAKGYVDIAGLKEGSYSFWATFGGKASSVDRVDVQATAGLDTVTLALRPGVFARAHIVDEADEPVAGARVTFSSGGLGHFTRHGVSNSEGQVRLGPLSDSRGSLQVRAKGFVPRVVELELPGPQTVKMTRAGRIVGRVVDTKGMPVVGATVEAVGTDLFGMPIAVYYRSESIADAHFDWVSSGRNVLVPAGELGVLLGPIPAIPLSEVRVAGEQTLSTNERGGFVIEGVPPGKVVVLARHADYMDGKSKVVSLAPGATGEVEIVLGEGKSLRGRVVDHRGFPVSNARVRVTGRRFERQVAVESDGTFSLAAAPDEVRLRISRSSRPLSVLFERVVTPEERESEVLVELPEPRDASVVRCVDSRGEPVGLARVLLKSRVKEVPLRATRFSSDGGEARFEEVRGLEVEVRVDAPGFVRRTVVVRKLPAEYEVKLAASLRVAGRIRAVRGRQPGSGARVRFEGGGVVRTVLADELGEYVLDGIPAGRGTLTAEHPEHGKGSAAVVVRAETRGRDAKLPDLVLEPPAVIRGHVVDHSGRRVSGAWLSTERVSSYLSAPAAARLLGRSDASGEFEVTVEASGTLYLYGASPGMSYGFSDAIRLTALNRAEGVELLLDRRDEVSPEVRGTVLVSVEEGARGIEIFVVAPQSSADRSGLQQGDVIVAIDGHETSSVDDTRELLSGPVGTDVGLTISRGGARRDLRVQRESFAR